MQKKSYRQNRSRMWCSLAKKCGLCLFPILCYALISDGVLLLWTMLIGVPEQAALLPVNAFAALLSIFFLGNWYRQWKKTRWKPDAEKPDAEKTNAGLEQNTEGMQKRMYPDMSLNSMIWIVLLGMASSIFFNHLLSYFPLSSQGYEETSAILYEPSFVVQVVCMVLVIPLAEELVFRGLVFQRLRACVTFYVAAISSALLFGIFHGNLLQGIFAFVMGWLLAYVMERYQKLFAVWVVHGASNLSSIFLTILSKQTGYRELSDRAFFVIMVCSGLLTIVSLNEIRKDKIER